MVEIPLWIELYPQSCEAHQIDIVPWEWAFFEPFISVLYRCWLKAVYCFSWLSMSLRLLVAKDTTDWSPEGWKQAKRRYHNLGFLPKFSSIS